MTVEAMGTFKLAQPLAPESSLTIFFWGGGLRGAQCINPPLNARKRETVNYPWALNLVLSIAAECALDPEL